MSVVENAPTSTVEAPGLVADNTVEEGRFTIPDVLVDEAVWYAFETVQRDDGVDKIPCAPEARRVRRINGHDPEDADLVEFDEAFRAVSESRRRFGGDGLAGVMLSLSSMDGLSVIDFDDCVDPETGEMSDFAAGVVEDLSDTFWEISPSSTGLHGYLLDSESLDDSYKTNGKVELYQTRGMTFTGRKLTSTSDSVSRIDGMMVALQRRHNSKKSGDSFGVPNETTSASNSAGVEAARDGGLTTDEFRRYRGAEAESLPDHVGDLVDALVKYTDDGAELYQDGHTASCAGSDASEVDASMFGKLEWWATESGLLSDTEYSQADIEAAFLTSKLAERAKCSREDYVHLTASHVWNNSL